MSTKETPQFKRIVETLLRLKSRIQDRPHEHLKEEYEKEITKYRSMRNGNDGGLFRDTSNTIRELHFRNWKNSDFQLLLEAVNESAIISDGEWEERFGHEKGFIGRVFGKKGRPE